MKKGILVLALLAAMIGITPMLFAEPAGELPKMVQAGFLHPIISVYLS